jgi:GxxExxY protein
MGQEPVMNYYDFLERDQVRADRETEELAYKVIGAALEVHTHLGPKLPESAYRKALSVELTLRGLPHECEAPVDILYKGVLVGEGRLDVLVGARLIVELKVVETLTDVHRAQVLAYLQAKHLQLGLLINFNVAHLRDGIKRVILIS